MDKLKKLREKHAQQVAQMQGIHNKASAENRELTEAEATEWDNQNRAASSTLSEINRITAMQGHEAVIAAQQEVVPAAARGAEPTRAGGPEAKKEFETFGHFIQAVRYNPNDERLASLWNEDGHEGARAEQRMDTGSQGGFMVPKQFRPDLLRVESSETFIRSRATVIPAGDYPDAEIDFPVLDQTGNQYGGIQLKWIGEGDVKPDTGVAFRQFELKPNEIAGTITITDKLMRNAPSMSALLMGLFREAGYQAEEAAFISGDGVKKPRGVLASNALIKVNRGTANTYTVDDLARMVDVFKGKNGTWVLPLSARSQVAKFRDPAGNFVYIPASNGYPATLFGYPIDWTDNGKALGTLGDVMLVDWKQYYIKDGSGPYVATSEHVYFTSNKTVMKYFWNVDGAPALSAPVKGNDGVLYSPFVALDVPAA